MELGLQVLAAIPESFKKKSVIILPFPCGAERSVFHLLFQRRKSAPQQSLQRALIRQRLLSRHFSRGLRAQLDGTRGLRLVLRGLDRRQVADLHGQRHLHVAV